VAVVVLVAAVVAVVMVRRDGTPRYRTVAAAVGDVAAQLVTTGTVTPLGQANLSFAIAGEVTSVTATVGQQVAAGTVLATVDTTALDAQVAQANSQLASAEARLAADRDGQTGASTGSAAGAAGPAGAGGTVAPAAFTGSGQAGAAARTVPAAAAGGTGGSSAPGGTGGSASPGGGSGPAAGGQAGSSGPGSGASAQVAAAQQAVKDAQDKVVGDQKTVDGALTAAKHDLDAETAACAPILALDPAALAAPAKAGAASGGAGANDAAPGSSGSGSPAASPTGGSGVAGSGTGGSGVAGSGAGGSGAAGSGTDGAVSGSGDSAPPTGDRGSHGRAGSGSGKATSSATPAAYIQAKPTPSPADALQACQAALTTVLADQQAVAKAQATLASDEAALDSAVGGLVDSALQAANAGKGGGATSGTSAAEQPGAGDSGAASPSAGGGGTGARTAGGGTAGGGSAGGGAGGGATGGAARTPGVSAAGAAPAAGAQRPGGASTGGAKQAPSASQLAADQAAVDSAQASLDSARQNLAQASLVAPTAGIVGAVSVTVGQQVAARASAPQIVVLGQGVDQVVTQVGESDIGRVRPGDAATVTPDGQPAPLPGTVVAVGLLPSGTGSPVTYPVTIGLTGTPPALPAGSGASVALTVASATGVLTVPTSAVHTDPSGTSVTVLRDGAATPVPVALGAVGAGRTQIVSGLQAGDAVVLADLTQPLPSAGTAGLRGLGGGQGGPARGTGGG
jgi:multidrug efflux pump subunit AcrA (membrane-fusion protein)